MLFKRRPMNRAKKPLKNVTMCHFLDSMELKFFPKDKEVNNVNIHFIRGEAKASRNTLENFYEERLQPQVLRTNQPITVNLIYLVPERLATVCVNVKTLTVQFSSMKQLNVVQYCMGLTVIINYDEYLKDAVILNYDEHRKNTVAIYHYIIRQDTDMRNLDVAALFDIIYLLV